MKHLAELWSTVEAHSVPLQGTREEFREMFEACDRLIEFKLKAASRVSLADVSALMYADLEAMGRRLVATISTMEPAQQTAAAERARALVTDALQRAFSDVLAKLAEKASRTEGQARA